MKSKQKKFLEKLGYIVEDITYTVFEDGGRYCEDSYSQHEVSLAYKTETEGVKDFKETKSHWTQAHRNYHIQDFILERVYKQEFENTLYEIALDKVSRKKLVDNFRG